MIFKILVFIAVVYVFYRWYCLLKKVVYNRLKNGMQTPQNRFDLSQIEEADYRDISSETKKTNNE